MRFSDLTGSRSRLASIVPAQKRGSGGRRRLFYVGDAAEFFEHNLTPERAAEWDAIQVAHLLGKLAEKETDATVVDATLAVIELLRREGLLLE